MCACKETDVRESLNVSIFAGGERHGSCGETCHPQYRKSLVSSVIEHPLLYPHGDLHFLAIAVDMFLKIWLH
jgi:hypothetical protein